MQFAAAGGGRAVARVRLAGLPMDHSTANRDAMREVAAAQLRARVMIVGSAGAVEQLTYCVPPPLEERLTAGSRVLVPLRSRRVTAIVLEVGENLDAGGVAPRAVL